MLHEAIALATAAGDRATAVTAHRELGFVEVQAGRRATADTWLAKAQALAETDEELAAILGVRGMNASDRGDYPAAFDHLDESVERAARCGDRRQQAWSLSILGRAHLLRGERARPWPRSPVAGAGPRTALDGVPALAAVAAGGAATSSPATSTTAADGLEHAWVLACQLGDPCWEGMAARGLGLLHAGRGDHEAAAGWLGEAAARCNRVPDRYQWVHALRARRRDRHRARPRRPPRAAPMVAASVAGGPVRHARTRGARAPAPTGSATRPRRGGPTARRRHRQPGTGQYAGRTISHPHPPMRRTA